MADSAAATQRMNNENNCPFKSSSRTEKTIKRKFTDNSVNSIDISIRIIFFRLTIMPRIPNVNRINPNCKKFSTIRWENRDSNPGALEEHFISNEAQ